MENGIINKKLDTVENVIELYPENPGNNIGKIVGGVAAVGAVVALGIHVYRIVKAKKAQKDQEKAEAVDNVKVMENDFLEKDTEE